MPRLRSLLLFCGLVSLTATLPAQSLMMECVTAKRQEQRSYPDGLPGTGINVRGKRLAKIAVDISVRNLGEEIPASLQIVFFARRAVTNDRIIIARESVPLRFGKGQTYKGLAESPQIEATELYDYGSSNSRVISGFMAEGWLVQLKSGERVLKQVASQSVLEEIGRDPAKLKTVRLESKGASSIQGEMVGGVAAGAAPKAPSTATAPTPAAPAAATAESASLEAASPTSPALTPAEFDKQVAASRARAVGKFPELTKAGSPLNQKFVKEVARLRAAGDVTLRSPDWPERVAELVSAP